MAPPLLQKAGTYTIDAPQKIAVWQDDQGRVWLTFNSAEYLADNVLPRHGLSLTPDQVKNLQQFMDEVTDQADQIALSLAGTTSGMGQRRRFGDVRATSGLPLKPTFIVRVGMSQSANFGSSDVTTLAGPPIIHSGSPAVRRADAGCARPDLRPIPMLPRGCCPRPAGHQGPPETKGTAIRPRPPRRSTSRSETFFRGS